MILKAKAAFIKNKELISPVYLVIENGVIQKISRTPVGANDHSPLQDLKNQILLPGLTNAHCHLELTAIGPLPKAPFTEWLGSLLRARKQKTDLEIQNGITTGIKQLIRSGVTTILDHISHWTSLEAYQNAKIRVIGFGEIMGANFENAKTSLEIIASPRVPTFFNTFYPSPHAIYSVHPDILKDILKNKSHPFSIHMAESEEEKKYFENFSGPIADFIKNQKNIKFHDTKSGFEFYQKYCSNLNQTLFIHGNDFSDSELDKISKLSQKCIVHCPGSFDFFHHKYFPFEKIRKRKIPIALGTDSLASNTGLNMLTEIQYFLKNRPDLPFEDLLPMATTNALEAIDVKNIGKIEEGYQADLIGFDWDGEKDLRNLFLKNQGTDFVMSQGEVL